MSAPSPLFGFIIDSLGFGEIGAVAILAMIVVGPERFPEIARGAGRSLAQFKRMIDKMTGDIQDMSNDPAMAPLRDLGEFALRPKQKLAELIREAELDLQLAEQRAASATGAEAEEAARMVAESEAELAEIEAAMASTEPRPAASSDALDSAEVEIAAVASETGADVEKADEASAESGDA